MDSIPEFLQLCRLCLMKDEVNTPIFEDEDDISQIFLKISACLHIKVSRKDSLPKNICDSCTYKLELFYEFLNTSTASEKQLLTWLNQLDTEEAPSKAASSNANPTSVILKQELPELLDAHSVDLGTDDLNISETRDYVLQQQQLPYESVDFEFQQGFMDSRATTNVATTTSSKRVAAMPNRKRRAASLKALKSMLDSDDDTGLVRSKITKTEGDHENNTDRTFVDLPSESGDNDQPGPSGVGKTATDAPVAFITYGQLAVFTKLEDHIELLYSENQENDADAENSVDSFSFQDIDENFDDYQVMKLIEEEGLKEIFKPSYKFKPKYNSKAKPIKKKYALCSICGKYVTLLEKHMKVYHGTFKCSICITTFRTERELEAHKELHGNNEYPCTECTLSFKKPIDCAYHSKEHCGLKSYSCPLCHFKTPARGSIKIHIRHHEKDYKYTCEMCNRGFISNSVYTEHVEGHAGIKRFKCDICFKTFLYKRYLMVHRKLNHKKILEGYEDVNECHVCHRKFSFEKSLIRHLSKIHGIGKDLTVDCTVCNKKIANPYNLKMHMRTHTGEKPYVCETCGKAFTKRINLRRHLRNLHD